MVVSELAVIEFTNGKPTLMETAPGVTVAQVSSATEAELDIASTLREMRV
jgi:acetate CoA/acetoacetate CoA-transferase beta subunit